MKNRLMCALLAISIQWPAAPFVRAECPEFIRPERVEIEGLPPGAAGLPISTEEPFLSRDGGFLFFNSGESENNKDLHIARRMPGGWKYLGEVGPAINTAAAVQAAASMDDRSRLYFTDSSAPGQIRRGVFVRSTRQVAGIENFNGVPPWDLRFYPWFIGGNMDIEISADGKTAFFSRAYWALNGGSSGQSLAAADILMSRDNGRGLWLDLAGSLRILKRINTADLEYAPSLSRSERELYFTRVRLSDLAGGVVRSRILCASRRQRSDAFGPPKEISAIGEADFVEAPAISHDGAELYYHRFTGDRYRIFRVVRRAEERR